MAYREAFSYWLLAFSLKPVPEGPLRIARRFQRRVGEREEKSVPEGRLKSFVFGSTARFSRAYGTGDPVMAVFPASGTGGLLSAAPLGRAPSPKLRAKSQELRAKS